MTDESATDGAVTPEDAVAIAQQALSKINELEGELANAQDRIDHLAGRVVELEVDRERREEEREYEDLSRDEKIGKVRRYGFREARENGGGINLEYNDIKRYVFDGQPSAMHCYDLMRWAANGQGTNSGADGFEYRESSSRTNHLHVDAAEARRWAAAYSKNKHTPDIYSENKAELEGDD